jgi:hypothetical protein
VPLWWWCLACAHVLGEEYPPGQDITHQVDRLIAFIGLDAINRQDQPAVCAHLGVPGVILGDLLGRPHQCAIGLKQIEHLAVRDGEAQRRQALLESLVDLVMGLVLGQAQLVDQQHNVEPKGKAGQGECISLGTAIGTGVGGTIRIGTARAAVGHAYRSRQRDDRAFRQGGITAQPRAAGQAVHQLRTEDLLGHLG